MTKKIRIGLVQMCSSDDAAENVRIASSFIREAAKAGADFVATPENTCLMAPDGGAKVEQSRSEAEDMALPVFCDLARELGRHLLIGSLSIRLSPSKVANRSILITPTGDVAARYDKIHLFDVDLPNGERYRESATVESGKKLVTADLPFGRVGLSICYDLRFPHLYRAMGKAGCAIITVPSAFTHTTGQAHWHTLLRARAIENGTFVLAPAQGGIHANGRHTFGHSLVIGPWGDIRAEGGTDPGVILADIDIGECAVVRARVPSLLHDRDFAS